jgi:hypothetical protein
MSWLQRIPYAFLILFAVVMMVVPFGASHFVEKWTMLFRGTLRRPIDWFDLVFHSAPLILLIVKLAGDLRRR